LKKVSYVKPGQYFLYIPRGMLVWFPAQTVHAGGFCFGEKRECRHSGPEKILVQNKRLHFAFCCTFVGRKERNGDTKFEVVNDTRKVLQKDFIPSSNVMDSLFTYLLDRNPKFEGKKRNKRKNEFR
jgi:hypothetical protein